MTEPALHPAGHSNRNRTKRATEVLIVEPRMPRREPLGEWLVFGARSLAAHRTARRVDDMRDDSALCRASLGTRPALDERDDCLVDLHRRSEVALMHPKLLPAEADHDVPVPRQLTMRDAP